MIRNPEERNDPPRPLIEHLVAVRDMLVFCAVSWALSFALACIFAPQVLSWLKSPAEASENLLQGLSLTSGFMTMLSIGIWGGTALSFPFLTYAVLRFVFPALTKREKAVLMSILVLGSGFFLTGTALAYAQTLPMVVRGFRGISEWMGLPVTVITIESYISIVLKTIIAFGLVFQLPLVLFVLGWFGVIDSAALRARRRLAIVLAFVVSMFLTPPDPMSQIVMAVPLCLLYELSVWALWLREKGAR